MRLIAGSILIGSAILALTLNGLDGGVDARASVGEEGMHWDISISMPLGLEIVTWLFLLVGTVMIIWKLLDIWHSHSLVKKASILPIKNREISP